MCEDCTQQREQIKRDLAALLNGEENELSAAIERQLPDAIRLITQRIDKAIANGEVPEEERPSEEEISEAVKDTLLAAVLATGAASLARHTPGYTDEGKMPASIIMGQWAGHLMEHEIDHRIAVEQQILQHLLGMGEN